MAAKQSKASGGNWSHIDNGRVASPEAGLDPERLARTAGRDVVFCFGRAGDRSLIDVPNLCLGSDRLAKSAREFAICPRFA